MEARIEAGHAAQAPETVGLPNTVPIELVEIIGDDFIPFGVMSQSCDAKATGDNELSFSGGADYADAKYELFDAYWDAILGFANLYVK